ncbi:MAG: DUF86 domain-containing protein [Phycisphaerae bacterium]
MPRDREKYVFDMLDSCGFLLEFTEGESLERYIQDRAFRGAVERELQIIGEAMLQLRSTDAATARGISEHERIIGFRHVLVHGYDVLDPEIVWFVVKEKVPILRRELEGILGGGC